MLYTLIQEKYDIIYLTFSNRSRSLFKASGNVVNQEDRYLRMFVEIPIGRTEIYHAPEPCNEELSIVSDIF